MQRRVNLVSVYFLDNPVYLLTLTNVCTFIEIADFFVLFFFVIQVAHCD